jgi:hypothetical protein
VTGKTDEKRPPPPHTHDVFIVDFVLGSLPERWLYEHVIETERTGERDQRWWLRWLWIRLPLFRGTCGVVTRVIDLSFSWWGRCWRLVWEQKGRFGMYGFSRWLSRRRRSFWRLSIHMKSHSKNSVVEVGPTAFTTLPRKTTFVTNKKILLEDE